MALCDVLKQQLDDTEAAIVDVQAALETETDPDEARRLSRRLTQLQAQRTELRIAINQRCPAPVAAAGMLGLTGGTGRRAAAPKTDHAALHQRTKAIASGNRKVLRDAGAPAARTAVKKSAKKKAAAPKRT